MIDIADSTAVEEVRGTEKTETIENSGRLTRRQTDSIVITTGGM